MTPRLELIGLTKTYPGVIANEAVSLRIMPGEIHAILGENGAGKSTLMKMIYGAERPDAGDILYDGRQILGHSPAQARNLGIAMIYQHFALFESISVVENIALSQPGRVDMAALSERIATIGQDYGMPIAPAALVHDLSVGERQRAEIVRCLLQSPRLLILDEPTSVLTPQAVERLFVMLRRLAAEGCSILYISHKLDEVRALCDEATILRGGRVTGTVKPKSASTADLARLMVGADLPQMRGAPSRPGDRPALSLRGVSAPAPRAHGTALRDISFDLYPGEILGLAGVSGNGQAELAALLSGERLLDGTGEILLFDRPAGQLGPEARRTAGMAFVPEERLGRGAVPGHSLWQNAVLTGHRAGLTRGPWTDRSAARRFAQDVIERFRVKANGPEALAQSLSGGNLQKFIVGREVALAPRMFLLSQPTWGVDVGAAALIRQQIVDLSREGAAVLVISEELEELFEISDRLMVICQGRVTAPIPKAQATREGIGLLMTQSEGGTNVLAN